MLGNEFGQGIDVSYTMGYGMNMIEGCNIVGGMEGIATHVSDSEIAHNTVSRTEMHGIAMTEMSMGMIAGNEVAGAVGAGIACVDQSMCMIEDNHVAGTKPDRTSPGLERSAGYGIVSDYKAQAELQDNELVGNAGRVGVFAGAEVTDPD